MNEDRFEGDPEEWQGATEWEPVVGTEYFVDPLTGELGLAGPDGKVEAYVAPEQEAMLQTLLTRFDDAREQANDWYFTKQAYQRAILRLMPQKTFAYGERIATVYPGGVTTKVNGPDLDEQLADLIAEEENPVKREEVIRAALKSATAFDRKAMPPLVLLAYEQVKTETPRADHVRTRPLRRAAPFKARKARP